MWVTADSIMELRCEGQAPKPVACGNPGWSQGSFSQGLPGLALFPCTRLPALPCQKPGPAHLPCWTAAAPDHLMHAAHHGRAHTRRAGVLSLELSVSPNLVRPVFPTDPVLSFPDLPGIKQERMRKGDSAVAEQWPLTDMTKAPELEAPHPVDGPRRRRSRVLVLAKPLTTFPREPRGAAWRQLFLSADVLARSGVLAPSPIVVTRWSPASSPIRPCGLLSPVWG